MTTAIATTTKATETDSMVASARQAIVAAGTAAEAFEVASRVKMAKAWATAHGKLRELRIQLLELEVAALVQVVRLGGAELLTSADKRAGEWLAAMTDEAISAMIANSGSTTTATGMCKAIWRRDEQEAQRQTLRNMGREWATGEERGRVRAAISGAMEDFAVSGVPFEVADFADDVADALGEPDQEFIQGVREMCRSAIRKAPTFQIEGTIIPKYVTSQLPDKTWVRVPVMNATYGDLLASLASREEQMKQDQAALDKFSAFVGKVATYTSKLDARLGDVLASSIEMS